ncbi:SAM-dependent methyltransferase [Rhodanobacter sp. AS-Z3]|uniref:SAM-dependent methyltransferase n=1 Tax=Rhodanobacter sp. AS-Z3 TaxID=3031330 RepID=UPI002478E878|nr:SAM-dependent methyltransferase [Rhodanobacter sp. AS-Z3]WEN15840.1 SAM-dependent methyltransferase [Rhodanobacter sp. AS-Z3]
MNTTTASLPEAPVQHGSIACVGLGMTLGSHLSPLARSYIEQADVVFAALSDAIVEMWLERMHPDVRSLQPYYGKGDKSRAVTYREWVDVMMVEVRAGKKVCAAFYGHPGIFAWSPHEVIKVAREEGFQAHMEPGISAEDCLYADLGIDPGRRGCQHYEASQLLFCETRLNPGAYLVLWQVGLVGDRSMKRFATGPEYRQVLVDVLADDYPLDHELIIYRGATLPIEQPRIRRVLLRDLPETPVTAEETVVLPPAAPLLVNHAVRKRLAALDRAAATPT